MPSTHEVTRNQHGEVVDGFGQPIQRIAEVIRANRNDTLGAINDADRKKHLAQAAARGSNDRLTVARADNLGGERESHIEGLAISVGMAAGQAHQAERELAVLKVELDREDTTASQHVDRNLDAFIVSGTEFANRQLKAQDKDLVDPALENSDVSKKDWADSKPQDK